MSVTLRHCRLCASLKEMPDLVDLSRNIQIRNEIIEKLAIFSVNTVDFTDQTLPETVCIKCKDSMRDIYEFFIKIQHSQITLANEKNTLCISSNPSVSQFASVRIVKIENGDEIKDEVPVPCKDEVPVAFDHEGKSLFVECDTVKSEFENEDSTDADFAVSELEATASHIPHSQQKLNNSRSVKKETQKTETNDSSDDERFQCTACGKAFQSWKELQRHTSTDNDHRPRKRRKATIEELTCDICSRVFDIPAKLKYHKVTHTNSRSRDYVCDVCGKAFYAKDSLNTHKMIHNPEMQVCKICKKTFISLIRLRKHIKTHDVSKPFECDDCHRKFRTKYQLGRHMVVHSDIFPYSCEYCKKGFRFKNTLKTHENIHTGAKPFVCTVCGMDFTNWSNCNKHMVRKHGVSLAKRVKTAHGMMPLNQETLKPKEVDLESVKWSEQMSKPRKRGRKKQDVLNLT